MARYNGAEDFERKYAATGDREVGSRMDPVILADLCDCENDE